MMLRFLQFFQDDRKRLLSIGQNLRFRTEGNRAFPKCLSKMDELPLMRSHQINPILPYTPFPFNLKESLFIKEILLPVYPLFSVITAEQKIKENPE